MFNKTQCTTALIDYCQKPSIDFYNFFLSSHLKGERKAIFVDDKQSNIDAISALGYHGICFENARQLERELNIMGVFKGHSEFVRMWEEREGKRSIKVGATKKQEERGLLASDTLFHDEIPSDDTHIIM